MPFVSKSQRRACWAKHHEDLAAGRTPSWDCREFEADTPKDLPEKAAVWKVVPPLLGAAVGGVAAGLPSAVLGEHLASNSDTVQAIGDWYHGQPMDDGQSAQFSRDFGHLAGAALGGTVGANLGGFAGGTLVSPKLRQQAKDPTNLPLIAAGIPTEAAENAPVVHGLPAGQYEVARQRGDLYTLAPMKSASEFADRAHNTAMYQRRGLATQALSAAKANEAAAHVEPVAPAEWARRGQVLRDAHTEAAAAQALKPRVVDGNLDLINAMLKEGRLATAYLASQQNCD